MAETFTFGKNQGCGFLTEPCINPDDGMPNFPEFCNPDLQPTVGCTSDYMGFAYCEHGWYDFIGPESWDYYNGTAAPDGYTDNCNYYWGVRWGICTISDNINNLWEEDLATREEVYGANSRCFVGTYGRTDRPDADLYGLVTYGSCHEFEVSLIFSEFQSSSALQVSLQFTLVMNRLFAPLLIKVQK